MWLPMSPLRRPNETRSHDPSLSLYVFCVTYPLDVFLFRYYRRVLTPKAYFYEMGRPFRVALFGRYPFQPSFLG